MYLLTSIEFSSFGVITFITVLGEILPVPISKYNSSSLDNLSSLIIASILLSIISSDNFFLLISFVSKSFPLALASSLSNLEKNARILFLVLFVLAI